MQCFEELEMFPLEGRSLEILYCGLRRIPYGIMEYQQSKKRISFFNNKILKSPDLDSDKGNLDTQQLEQANEFKSSSHKKNSQNRMTRLKYKEGVSNKAAERKKNKKITKYRI